jgi:hypothetical protein
MDDLEKIYYVDYNPSTEEIFIHLSYISDLLKKNNIKHWINYGTLLGAVRQKDIIPYDYDFDLGVLIEDTDNIIALNPYIENDGYKLELTKGTLFNINKQKEREYLWRVSIKIVYQENPVGDLYIYSTCEDDFMRRFDKKQKIYFWPNSTFPCELINEIEFLEIRDKKFPAPKFSEILVLYFYGPLWKTPIRSSSQNGENHEDYDFYGNYKYSNLVLFVDFFKEKGIYLKPDFSLNNYDWVFPLEQIDWIKINEINNK